MDEQSRLQEIEKLRSAIAAGSHDFRNIHRRLAEHLMAIGQRRQAASVVLQIADSLWANGDVSAALVVVRLAPKCAPDDLVVRRMFQPRYDVMRAAVDQQCAQRYILPRIRAHRISLVPSPSS